MIQTSQYVKPKKEEEPSHLGTIGTIVGGVAGAFAGNPMAGASIGKTVGEAAEGATAKKQETDNSPAPVVKSQGDSMSRRLQSLDEEKSKKLTGLA